MNIQELEKTPIQQVGQTILERIQSKNFQIGQIVDMILEKGVLCQASDIHLSPIAEGLRIRYRIDGLFEHLVTIPSQYQEQIVAYTKVRANLMSHKREVIQEGRVPLKISSNVENPHLRGRTIDLRISIVPTVLGEKMVIRIFYPQQALIELKDIGYNPSLLANLQKLLFDLQGMVILTGPSGSGKTTTLYSSMYEIVQKLDRYASVVTIEDPVEYTVGRFCQMQVDRLNGITFARGLSAILRQDPEVIMVGEIRDSETCEVALRAGLTGHLILTTIHSGTSYEVITRLINMGIEPFVIASAVTGILAQRLVRRICPQCEKISYRPERRILELFRDIFDVDNVDFKKGKGCPKCENTGYKGRTPIAELLIFNEDIRDFVLKKAKTSMIRDFVIQKGMQTFLHDGIQKAIQGITTLEEVFRVVSYKEIADVAASCRKQLAENLEKVET
ncbi:MAG: type II/IV secretion system protein [Planctomycetota bacterium]|nr:MAG: type II/IV secretion system protein [Planctomycetota bacterium]